MKFLYNMLVYLPTPKTLTYYWNLGSFLAFILFMQLISGVVLVFYYSPTSTLAFFSVNYLMTEVSLGWFIRIIHFNGASLFFFCLYFHFFKGLVFLSFRLTKVWMSGIFILFLLMAIGFMGYVLVWAQMSFWAAVVITSLISVVPFLGPALVSWVWGGFNVVEATLKFFFVFHFLLPWVLLLLVCFHLIFLHKSGSSSKLYLHNSLGKVSFFDCFWWKDSVNFVWFFCFFFFVCFFPFVLGDCEMFIEADPMISPVHIVPEWYFLFAYAVLRAIPNKPLGVISLILTIVIFFLFCFMKNSGPIYDIFFKLTVGVFFVSSVILSWLGQCQVVFPFLLLSGVFSFIYFFLVFSLLFICVIGFVLFFVFIMKKMY